LEINSHNDRKCRIADRIEPDGAAVQGVLGKLAVDIHGGSLADRWRSSEVYFKY
jgi:hypothetical protein